MTRVKAITSRLKSGFLPPAITFVVFFGIWQIGVQLADIPPYLLPKPTDILRAATDNYSLLLSALWTTAVESLLGFALSIVIGVLGAILLATSKTIEKGVYPYAIILQTIPIVAIAPIIVIWIGAGTNAVIAITFLIGFFPMLSNTLIGLNSVDRNLTNLFHLYSANRWQTMWQLRIPAALPYVVAGLRISCTLSVIGAIVGEYIAGIGGGKGGLGFSITNAALRLQIPYLFACGLAASLLGIVVFLGVNALSRRLLSSWHESELSTEH
ncbi:ABC transporter permease [Cohnella abietis]|uniref:ABC transporter ATP-binding protein n=1 Tax=Cohnella abietis TaxID=2507935 RepID=A0A3T1D678_9BACL|nr:ABC transporter permease [Cohnella abietis]BBI33582.1 ABC transporter ATP-binding protein [Cohnella abietis]